MKTRKPESQRAGSLLSLQSLAFSPSGVKNPWERVHGWEKHSFICLRVSGYIFFRVYGVIPVAFQSGTLLQKTGINAGVCVRGSACKRRRGVSTGLC